MNDWTIHQGDCLAVLKTLPSESVHCVVTSPPYFGLRDYGTAKWQGGDLDCDHVGNGPASNNRNFVDREGRGSNNPAISGGTECRKCGAVRVDGQIGLEATPAEFVAKMVEVFAEVHRVLRKDGTLWLNLGDSYAGSWGNYGGQNRGNGSQRTITNGSQVPNSAYDDLESFRPPTSSPPGMKPKDLMGMPWRVAFALQEWGWWLRQDLIWNKPNPMPESVTDRCTKSHEYIFLLTKSAKYFYDAEAIREEGRDWGTRDRKPGSAFVDGTPGRAKQSGGINCDFAESGRNKRSVWTVTTQPFPEAHFATFPPKLIEPCILAGTSEKGCCLDCGAPWERIVEKSGGTIGNGWHDHTDDLGRGQRGGTEDHKRKLADAWESGTYKIETLGWRKTCNCSTDELKPCTVLDPFSGAATTGLVAVKHRRQYIGIELNPEYIAISERRMKDLQVKLF